MGFFTGYKAEKQPALPQLQLRQLAARVTVAAEEHRSELADKAAKHKKKRRKK